MTSDEQNQLNVLYEQTRLEPFTGCRVWRGKYYRIPLESRNRPVRYLVWMLTNGELPDGKYPTNGCPEKRCIAAEHLVLKDLEVRSYGPSLWAYGMSRKQQMLKDETARAIIRRFKEGATPADVSKEFDVPYHVAYNIGRRRTYEDQWRVVNMSDKFANLSKKEVDNPAG